MWISRFFNAIFLSLTQLASFVRPVSVLDTFIFLLIVLVRPWKPSGKSPESLQKFSASKSSATLFVYKLRNALALQLSQRYGQRFAYSNDRIQVISETTSKLSRTWIVQSLQQWSGGDRIYYVVQSL